MENNTEKFELVQRQAKALSLSTMIPKDYQNNIPNTLVALEMAQRLGASPLMVMQNLHIIHGRPSWSSTFIIAALNSCGRFTALRFEMETDKCRAVSTEHATGHDLYGPWVTMEMAKAAKAIPVNFCLIFLILSSFNLIFKAIAQGLLASNAQSFKSFCL